jgi:hypothetical protein
MTISNPSDFQIVHLLNAIFNPQLILNTKHITHKMNRKTKLESFYFTNFYTFKFQYSALLRLPMLVI